jgi:hypothetical protein
MKILAIIARILLGLAFTIFGLNGFLHFLHQPPPSGLGGQFAGALFVSGYFYVIFAIQLIGGLILLSGRFISLGLLLLGPVIVNILLFHIFLEHTGLPIAIVVALLSLVLLAAQWPRFAPLFKP